MKVTNPVQVLRRLPSVRPLSSSGGQKSNNCIFRSCSSSSQDCHKHEEYEILSDLPESVVFHCRLCRGAEGGEAGWRVAVNEYMHTSFTEASISIRIMDLTCTSYSYVQVIMYISLCGWCQH